MFSLFFQLSIFINNKLQKITIMKTNRLNAKQTNVVTVDVNEFDNVNSSNLNLVVTKQVKAKKASNKSAIAVKLDSIDNSKSTQLTKAIKSLDFLFSSIRSIILALIANNQSLNVFDKSELIATLRRSKKEVDLYVKLRKIAAFNYKAIKTKVNDVITINIVKSFTVKSVVRACEVFNNFSSVELTENLLSEILHENELQAVETLKKQVETLQAKCNTLSNLIENLKDTAKVEKDELSEQLNNAEVQLTEKVKILTYVNFQSNRILIK